MQIGFVGFGKMGSRMVGKLLLEGHTIVAWNRTRKTLHDFQNKNTNPHFSSAASIPELVKTLETPRVVWMMLPAGDATKTVFDELLPLLGNDDILIDGGNAYYKDTQKRFDRCEQKGIRFLGIGVSGGIHAAENGFPLMVGGNVLAYQYIKTVMDSLSKPHGGHHYFGTGGAGHFIKMVHNGIEYGMMQAIGEGLGVMEKSPYKLDLVEVVKLWQKGTIVSSFLINRARDGLEKDPKLSGIDGVIDATGEAEWTVAQAKEEGVPIENIEQSVNFRKRSKTEKTISDSFAAKVVAMLRAEFGGHSLKKKN